VEVVILCHLYRTKRFIDVLSEIYHLTLSWPSLSNYIPSYPASLLLIAVLRFEMDYEIIFSPFVAVASHYHAIYKLIYFKYSN